MIILRALRARNTDRVASQGQGPGGRFLLLWLVANALGWALAWYVLETVFTNGARSSIWIAGLPAGGALLALAQYMALRRHVGIGPWWIVPGAVAWLAGSVGIVLVMGLLDARVMPSVGPAIGQAIFARTNDAARANFAAGAAFGLLSGVLTGAALGILVGIGQWLVLRLSLRRGTAWVLVNIASWAAAWAAYWGAYWGTYVAPLGVHNPVLVWAAAALLSGIAASVVSGPPLLWLLRRAAAGPLPEWQPAELVTVTAH
jgi:hypothetical protein